MAEDLSKLSNAELLERYEATLVGKLTSHGTTPASRATEAELRRRLSIPRLFDKPQGPARLGPMTGLGGFWCIGGRATEKAIVCQGCGTEHPETPGKAKTVSELGSITIVDACCGAWLDRLFEALGQTFCGRYIDLLLESKRVIASGPISHLPDIIIVTPVDSIIPR